MRLFLLTFILISISIVPNSHAEGHTKPGLDSKLRDGILSGQYVLLMRHAMAPGTGDPDHFDVNDCSTQRNLSEKGRQQARRIGERLRDNGIRQARVFSSQWCRCLETARLLDLGEVTGLPVINSFFRHMERRSEQTRQLREWLSHNKSAQQNGSLPPAILVTHQVNITVLTGVFPRSGELLVIDIDDMGKVTVMAQLTLND